MDEIKIKQKAFSNPELAAFCGQLSLILHSGISSLEGISILLEDSKDPEEQVVLQRLLERLQETGSLATAFADAGLFPAYLLSMTELGEQTGTLDEVMKALSLHYEREEAISRNVKNALTYPLIMSAMMAAVIVILLVKVMPIFQQVFRQLGTEMTGFSRALMGLGTALNQYSILFIVLLLLVIAAAFAGTHTAGGRRFFRKIGLHFSRIRSMQEQLSVCRFASGMAISLKSGLTQEQSLELTERLIEDADFCKKLEACRNGLSEGQDLAALLHQEQILTGVYARMASIGARTGELDAVLERIADLCQEDLDDRMNRTLAVLEPTLVITLSLIVGVILLSAMLPLMGILSSL